MSTKPPAVLLVGHYAADRQMSMARYGDLVARLLAERGHAVTRLAPEPVFGRWARGPLAKWAGHVDKWILFPGRLRKRLRDLGGLVMLPDHSHGPYVPVVLGHPHVVTVHDLMAIRGALGELPAARPRWSGRRLQTRILAGLRRAEASICVSGSTLADLRRLAPKPAARSRVIHHALNARFGRVPRAEALARLAVMPAVAAACEGPFLLHVGNDSWYKDRDAVVEVFLELRRSRPGLKLVMAGARPSASQQALTLAADPGAVTWAGPVPADVLEALYSLATVFVFPSIEEGFGWPPLEAQSCGCPVVASRGGALAEVLERGALLVEPRDRRALLASVASVLDNPGMAAALREEGHVNVARFGEATMGDAMASYLASLVGEARR